MNDDNDWYELHKQLVNEVVDFFKAHPNEKVDYIDLSIDGIQSSIEFGSWHPGTDSSLCAFDEARKETLLTSM